MITTNGQGRHEPIWVVLKAVLSTSRSLLAQREGGGAGASSAAFRAFEGAFKGLMQRRLGLAQMLKAKNIPLGLVGEEPLPMVLFGYLRMQKEGRSVEAPACEEGNPYSLGGPVGNQPVDT